MSVVEAVSKVLESMGARYALMALGRWEHADIPA
jgi:hypothetical protein